MAARGDLNSPLELQDIAIDQEPRGPIRFIGTRAGKTLLFDLPPGRWHAFDDLGNAGTDAELRTRPPLSRTELEKYEAGLQKVGKGQVLEGVAIWENLAATWSRGGDHLRSIWLGLLAAKALSRDNKPQECERLLQGLLNEAREQRMEGARILVWHAKATSLNRQVKIPETIDAYREIVRLGTSLPGSLWPAFATRNIGYFYATSGNPSDAVRSFQQALSDLKRLAPGSIREAVCLSDLSIVTMDLGDATTAEAMAREALSIEERLDPPPRDRLYAMINLGHILVKRGNLAAADEMFRRSLALSEPDTPDEFQNLNNLGVVALHRGDLAAAEQYNLHALRIVEKASPQSRSAAQTLGHLGEIAAAGGDLVAAETYYRRALAIQETRAPGKLDVAAVLNDLGEVANRKPNFSAARSYFQKALAIEQNLAPQGPEITSSLAGLGQVALAKNELSAARAYYLQSLAILERVASGSQDLARTLHALGVIARREKNLTDAASYFERAVDALDAQQQRLGGTSDTKSAFTARYDDFYKDYVQVLLELGRKQDALLILERSRARALLAILAERDLFFASDIPIELERDRKAADIGYDQASEKLRLLKSADQPEVIGKALVDLREARERQTEVADRIKKLSPRYGSLRYPQPLSLDGTRAALDPGTLLLCYSLGTEKSFLFVVSADPKRAPPLSVVTLPVGEKTLRDSVEAFRALIEWNQPFPIVSARSHSLYDMLLKPIEPLIERFDRLLILPDGPLHTLPWAALVREVRKGQLQYLGDWRPLHTVLSATVYAELKKSRMPDMTPAIQVAAFGDAKYPELPERRVAVKRGEYEEGASDPLADEITEVEEPQLRAIVRNGYRLGPLPASRKEVEQIAALYAPKSAAYLGPDATEERAKAIGKDVPIIHFATHAVINERFPLDSALVFTIPEHPKEGQDNGLLQAWEIFERMRIDADLVTLSACDSGLGREMGGEGLIGLTRAFQYAGARTVLASLWKVEDKATAELMKRFYSYLKAGKTKDEALRSAQIDLIHSTEYSNPRDWAAFQLNGDWK